MTKSDHEKERRAFWDANFVSIMSGNGSVKVAVQLANACLAERDKRFPAPEGDQ